MPHVAGAAALLKAADPELKFSKAKKILLETAVRLPSLVGKCVSGGKLDVGAALDKVLRSRDKEITVAEWLSRVNSGGRFLR